MLLKKVINNFGGGAVRALGFSEYAQYVSTTLRNVGKVLASHDLRAVDATMRGIVQLYHPVTRQKVQVDLEIFRADDIAEGSFAFGLLREIWFRNVYLREFPLADKLQGVIDLGSNRGLFTLLAAAFSDRVVAVEVQSTYRRQMKQLLTLNGLSNVSLINAFVGGPGVTARGNERAIEFKDVVAALDGSPVDFLKMDIEGSEFGIDVDAFSEVRRMAIEVHRDWGDAAEFVSNIEQSGFDCRTFDDSLRSVTKDKADFLFAINKKFPEARWK